MENLARIFIWIGIGFLTFGALILLGAKTGIQFGRLPGDIQIQNNNWTCFFPIVSGLVLSIVFTILLNILIRLLNR